MISKELKDYLFTFGLSYKYRGFPWLMIALEIIERDVMALGMIKDTIYLQIAEDVNTNIACIERNFRTLSEIAFNTNKTDLEEIMGTTLERRLRVSDFLCVLHEGYERYKAAQ